MPAGTKNQRMTQQSESTTPKQQTISKIQIFFLIQNANFLLFIFAIYQNATIWKRNLSDQQVFLNRFLPIIQKPAPGPLSLRKEVDRTSSLQQEIQGGRFHGPFCFNIPILLFSSVDMRALQCKEINTMLQETEAENNQTCW